MYSAVWQLQSTQMSMQPGQPHWAFLGKAAGGRGSCQNLTCGISQQQRFTSCTIRAAAARVAMRLRLGGLWQSMGSVKRQLSVQAQQA